MGQGSRSPDPVRDEPLRIDALSFDRDEKRLSMTVSSTLFRAATFDEGGLMHGDRAFVFSRLAVVAQAAEIDERAFTLSGTGALAAPHYVLFGKDTYGVPIAVVVEDLPPNTREEVADALADVLATVYALLVMP
jgi:hypothetical protein